MSMNAIKDENGSKAFEHHGSTEPTIWWENQFFNIYDFCQIAYVSAIVGKDGSGN